MAAKAPKFTPLPPETPQGESAHEPYKPQSHVTNVPDKIEGQNFNPRIRVQYGNEPNVVHAARPIEPVVSEISEELQQKHEASTRQYPTLNLTEGEFVILDIQRHPIGLFVPIGIATVLIIVLLSGLFIYPSIVDVSTFASSDVSVFPSFGFVAVVVALLCGLIGAFSYISVWIYLRNRFYLTNESVIQELQYGLFSHHEQTASLGSIEDVSYLQHGILETMFNYGSIRLSTEGEETTYRFYFVANPKKQTATLTNAVEAYKNGRPVSDN